MRAEQKRATLESQREASVQAAAVAEVGVHHYPRLHGKSQFFRVKSLATTLAQLIRLWIRTVIRRR